MERERSWSAPLGKFPDLQSRELFIILTDGAVRNGNPLQRRTKAARILVSRGHQPTIETLRRWLEQPEEGIRQFIGTYYTGDTPTAPREYPDPGPDSTAEQLREMAESLLNPDNQFENRSIP